MTRTLIIGAVCALAGGATTAAAQTSHILGWDGPQVPLDVTCRRAVIAPPGETFKMAMNVTAQQVKCLIRRPDPFARCVRHATLTVVEKADHGVGKPGDETGAAAAINAIQQCAKATLR